MKKRWHHLHPQTQNEKAGLRGIQVNISRAPDRLQWLIIYWLSQRSVPLTPLLPLWEAPSSNTDTPQYNTTPIQFYEVTVFRSWSRYDLRPLTQLGETVRVKPIAFSSIQFVLLSPIHITEYNGWLERVTIYWGSKSPSSQAHCRPPPLNLCFDNLECQEMKCPWPANLVLIALFAQKFLFKLVQTKFHRIIS